MKVEARLGLNMTCRRRSKLEVDAGADELNNQVRGTVERIGSAGAVTIPSAFVVGKLAYRYSARTVQRSAKAYSQPAPAVQPTSDLEALAVPAPGGAFAST